MHIALYWSLCATLLERLKGIDDQKWTRQLLLEDGFFTEVINDLKNAKISDIISTNDDDVEARERAYTVIKTLDLIMVTLKA